MSVIDRRPRWLRLFDAESVRLGLPLLLLALVLEFTGTLARLDDSIYDAFLKLAVRPPPQDVVIVAIDQRSLEQLGRWPWPRRLHAQLLDRLDTVDTKAVAFDIAFVEAQVEPASGGDAEDAQLAAAIARHGRVILPVLPLSSAQGGVRELLPLPELARAAAQLGHVEVELDADAVSRRVFLKAGLDSPRWPALPLALLDAGRDTKFEPLPGERRARPDQPRTGWWARDHAVRISFAGPPGHFRQVSYVDVLNNASVAESLRGKFVLVGMTAAGLRGPLVTPVSGNKQFMSGVEFHANVLDNLRERRWITPLPWPLHLTLCMLAALACALVFPRLRPAHGLLALLSMAALLGAASFLLLSVAHLWIAPAVPLVLLHVGYPLWLWRRVDLSARALSSEQERSRATLESIGEAVVTTDRHGRIVHVNPAARQLAGCSAQEALGQHLTSVFVPAKEGDRIMLEQQIERCLRDGDNACPVQHILLRSRDGERAVRLAMNRLRQDLHESGGLVIALSDITETVAMNERMAHLATHDALTGLPNRLLLADRLQQAITGARRSNGIVAVLFLDLDGFKRVNDSLGHTLGDSLLVEVTQRLNSERRSSDTVARWGGDEFVIVVQEASRTESVVRVARSLLDSFAEPFEINQQELYVSASLGIAVYPRDGEDGETLLRNADAAMYRAKHAGRGVFQFHSENVNNWTRRHLELERGLRRALSNGELTLYYQPQVALHSDQLAGVEALLRWRHPEGIRGPTQFIPIAEESELILKVGEWVLHHACTQARAWHRAGLPALCVGINVSPRQFMNKDMVGLVRRTLAETQVAPNLVVLELTESMIMQDVSRVARTLGALKDEGVMISIDDFGTGYSSLSYLKRFPIDQIKIDQSFIRDITMDPDDAAITQAVIAMAHSMDISVVAEGVETEAQLGFLRARNCDQVQGYYFGAPLPADDFPRVSAGRQAA